jgi:hypothetical protein
MRKMHPLRLSYEMFGPRNPWLAWVDSAADRVRAARRPTEPDNPLVAMQAALSKQIVDGFEAWRRGAERLAEDTFHTIYGTPALQAALGVDTNSPEPPRKAARSKLHEALVERRVGELKAAMTRGGLAEALVRALLHVGMARNAVDERGFAAITRMRDARPEHRQMTLSAFKALVREQFLMLVLDEEAALRAIPPLLPDSIDDRRAAFDTLRLIVEASGAPGDAPAERLRRVAALFGLGPELVSLAPRDEQSGRRAS